MMLRHLGWLLLPMLTLAMPAAVAAEFREMGRAAPPPLVLKDSKGASHGLAAYKGKVVLVNFWATWCPPCRDEMPSMQRLKERMDGRPFVMLGVNSGETLDELNEFLELVKVDFPILLDPESAATRQWKVFGLPTSFLVDREGKVRYALTGPAEWDGDEVMAVIEEMMREKP